MRSDNETDIETSVALGQWSAMKDANTRLDNAYRRSGGHVIIFFSIVKRCLAIALSSQSHPTNGTQTVKSSAALLE